MRTKTAPRTNSKITKKVKAKAPEAETPEVKIAEISKEIVRVQKEASEIVVKTKEDYEGASKFLSGVVKPRVNRINELVEFFVAPHKKARADALESMRQIESRFEATIAPLREIESNVKGAMSAYLREEDEKARKEEKRIADLRAKQDERREEKGQAPIVTPLPTIARSEQTIKNADGGKTTAKKVWKFEVLDYKHLPIPVLDEIFAKAVEEGVAEKVIRKMVNAGLHEMSGVRIYEDFDISASAK